MFSGKVSVVTGGAKGIGRCISEAFLKAGADVAVIDVDAIQGEKLVEAYPGRVMFCRGDVAQQEVLEAFAAQTLDRFGGVDFLINNACFSNRGLLTGCSYEDFDYVLRMGVTAPYYLTLLLKDHFRPGGAVVNISSTRAFLSQADTESYTAAKGGIAALTHAMSASLAGRVRVNSVSPGWIDTGSWQGEAYTPRHSRADRLQHPAGRVGEPADIAGAVLFLCGKDAGFITGQDITVDGGMSKTMIYHDDCGWSFNPEKSR